MNFGVGFRNRRESSRRKVFPDAAHVIGSAFPGVPNFFFESQVTCFISIIQETQNYRLLFG
jgi:hypothetical protein